MHFLLSIDYHLDIILRACEEIMVSNVRVIRMQHKSASIDVVRWGDGQATITNLESIEKRQGHATELMQKVVEYLDKEYLYSILEVDGWGDDGLDNQELVKFYERFGYRVCSEGPMTLMERGDDPEA